MRSLASLVLSASLVGYAAASSHSHRDLHHHHARHELKRRNIVYDSQIDSEYDFVIVGGGTAGLAIASRLSENSSVSVLVLEAGDSGDAVADRINTPDNAYFNGLTTTSYDWGLTTVAQSNAAGRQLKWPRGKVLGGSSAVNGMYYLRGSKLEYDAWATLSGDDRWNWDGVYASMLEAETYTPPTSEVQALANIQYNAASHGSSGPLHASYPGFMIPTVGNWTQTLANIGVHVSDDGYDGDGQGAYIANSAINPTNWTRSYSRSAYIDPLPPRSNLAILPNATVTRIIFDTSNSSSIVATGVEYASDAAAARQTVTVKKEVILAGGTVGSPHVLMHSGVGPSDVLTAAGVEVVHELPGVGQHLQDHFSAAVTWSTTSQTAQGMLLSDPTLANSPEFLSYINSAIAYVNISDLVGLDYVEAFASQQASALQSSLSSFTSSSDSTVQAGYTAIYNNIATNFLRSSIGQVEILFSPIFNGSITIQAALQHPLSQGRIYITSNDPFAMPAIDPQYMAHEADRTLFREGLKLARKIGQTAPLSQYIGEELSPGSSVQTDDDWDNYAANNIGTEYHPSSSCAMLPLAKGGVVDGDLRVYGLANVRVADASVFPTNVAAHLLAPTYGLAEKAAKLIQATYSGVSTSSTGHSTTTTSTNTTAGDNTSDGTSGALSLTAGPSAVLAAAGALAWAML